jgi:hypothetical protein
MSYYNQLIETTDWGGSARNYIYYASERNTYLHGYQKELGGKFIPFKSRLFSTKGRTFIKKKVDRLPE